MRTVKKREKVGVQDIAGYLNISASTVSRALNDHPRISKETKERVMAAAKKLGYNPGLPELMEPEKAEAVAVLMPSLDSAFYRELAAGINNYLGLHNYHTFIINTEGDERKEELFFKTYKKYGVSGIIHVVNDRRLPDDFYKPVLRYDLPLVTICEPDFESGVSSVLPDVFQGFNKLVNYLHTLNIKSAAMILEDKNNPLDSQMEHSFYDSAEMVYTEGHNFKTHYFEREPRSFIDNITRLLKKENRPETLIIKDAFSALEVYSLAEKMGIRIPEDFLLIAIGSDFQMENIASNLSLLKMPGFTMGNEAAEILFDQIQNPLEEKKSAIIPVNFILKSSSIRI